MSFAFKEELNELVIFCRCCSTSNLWVLMAPISPVNYWGGWYIAQALWLKYWGGGARAPWSRRHWTHNSDLLPQDNNR